jgi:hypothetical protein
MKRLLITMTLLGVLCGSAVADEDSKGPVTIKDHTAEMEKFSGLFTYYWDSAKGKVWLEIEELGVEILYVSYVSRGLGSNDIGLDRGQISGTSVVYFRRIGPKVLMMEKNYDYRATAGDASQQTAVDESFAQSTLWGFEVKAEKDGRVLVDATDFILRDARDVVGSLRRSGQGRFSLESSRSAIEPARTRNFPENTEFEALLTYTSDTAGAYVSEVAPTPQAFTIGQHHSFVNLPEPGFKPRKLDPRCGYFGISYVDQSAPLSESTTRRFITRHRLEKTKPGPSPSEVVEPIVYYVDRGAPEPMRSALVEGASWWNEAFEAAGFLNAFRVDLMPEDADPLDVRYNTIQWVHRSTRGWSYGGAVVDPRTGEAIKGHVTLGSLRARQDYMIAEGVLGPYEEGNDADPRMRELALARLRQLSCHEVGHTLGLRHNYVASAFDRNSVMDYPYPYIALAEDGSIDVSDAYGVGVGEWDKAAITYGYQEFPDEIDQDSALADYLDGVFASGLVYLSDRDARSAGSAHPFAHLWDNGANAIDELDRLMKVRAKMLERFSERVIQSGTPMVMLEEALVPIYMYHRYQLQAVPKFVGGADYRFVVRDGSGDPHTRPVDANEQRRALRSLMDAVKPSALMLSEELLSLLQPQTIGYVRPREVFSRRTGDVFDLASAAEGVADTPIRYLLHPQRAARLEAQHAADSAFPGLGEVIDIMLNATWGEDRQQDLEGSLQRTVDNLILHHLIRLANSSSAPTDVRAIAYNRLELLDSFLTEQMDQQHPEADRTHFSYASRRIQQFLEDPTEFESYKPTPAPAGSPIGNEPGNIGCCLD